MSRWRSSPRLRRRAYWAAGLLSAGGALAALALGTQNRSDFPEQRLVDEPAQVVRVPKLAHLSRRDALAVLDTSTRFVRTAVAHRDLRNAYDLVGPDLRGGLTRAEWATGANPVVPFPAAGIAEWALVYSYRNDVALDLALVAGPGSDTVGKTFRIELRRAAREAPWRVVSWLPNGLSGPGNVRSLAQRQAQAPPGPRTATLGAWWLAFPVALLSLALVLPLGLWLRHWHAHRKADRAYRAERGMASEL